MNLLLHNLYVPLIIADACAASDAVKSILDSEGAINILWAQAADAALLKEGLQKSREFRRL